MPPRKKGSAKKKKLANMTEEERLLYLEQKQLAEEEMRKNKEDLLTQFLKEKLGKEEKYSKFNINKLNYQWRAIMREAKAKDLVKDIEVLQQTFERVVDRKDAIVKSLGKDLEEAEEQYQMALRSHLQNMDELIALQHSRLTSVKSEYDKQLEILKQEFDSERSSMINQNKKECDELTDIMFAMEQEFNERESDVRHEFQSVRDEIKNRNLEEKHALRIQLEGTVEDLWKQFEEARTNYTQATADRKTAFENLKAKDEKSAEEIEQQMRKLQRLTDQISFLKAKMASTAKESDERNKTLKEERESILVHFQELKTQMGRLRDADRARLTTLTVQSNNTLKELDRIKTKGQHILKIAEMCRKLEAEEEKVLPFYPSTLTKEEEDDIEAAMAEPSVEKLADMLHDYTSLDNFWKRYNKVLLEKLAIDKEKGKLVAENQRLKAILKQYLDGVSVNDEILSKANPLFVVNSHSNIPMSVPVMDSRVAKPTITTIDATQAVKHIV
ncbi:Coiled-coil domain-containing protein 65 [Trichoplax sp. H2]|uniref:Dynein regulatory complex subunit 2 n=1 Tax=Trichoplax adhaerens TaxID=10228 RepID=B3SAP1_TRIAD|nr:hypothetical protein TRIADDRAFT_32405 [Trichoplax adhaerens]EDV20189.1 hypothetical protein TRIADDRAFT_32405 [Trichoplax adhaerens]RDD36449.1 Coiled-coil domain-containing protein 65 [Trichoplax sp. H2]|eukprot:XP_002117350.1 hypothetical protein TRIADDRAFT_32405 [Trichoplax adhaerens]